MEEVISINPTADGLLLKSLFNEVKTVKAEIGEIDLLKNRIYLVGNNDG